MFKTIVVATDGSIHGDRAFEFASSMVRADGGRLVAVHVNELVGGQRGVVPLAADEPEIERRLRADIAELREDGIDGEVVVRTISFGGPAHLIAEIADSVDADVIIVGGRGHSAFTGVLLGSVPLRLMQTAHRPLLIVPPAHGSSA